MSLRRGKREETIMTDTSKRYHVNFKHSGDQNSSVVFASDDMQTVMGYMYNQYMYKLSFGHSLYPVVYTGRPMQFVCIEFAHFDESGKWGFRYWVTDTSEEETNRDISQTALDFDASEIEQSPVIKNAPYYLGLDYSRVEVTNADRLTMKQQNVAYTCNLEVIAVMERADLSTEEKRVKLGAIQVKYDAIYNALDGQSYAQ